MFLTLTTGWMVVSDKDQAWDRESRSVDLGRGCSGDRGGDNGQRETERKKIEPVRTDDSFKKFAGKGRREGWARGMRDKGRVGPVFSGQERLEHEGLSSPDL